MSRILKGLVVQRLNQVKREVNRAMSLLWQVQVLKPFDTILASQFHPERKFPTHFMLETAAGIKEEVNRETPVFKIKNKLSGELFIVDAGAAAHIISTHFKGESVGSQIKFDSLKDLLVFVAKKIPRKLSFQGNEVNLEIKFSRTVGTEGVTSSQEMLTAGIITAEDLEILNQAKDQVFALNKKDATDERVNFVKQFNADNLMGRNVKLGIRGPLKTIVVFYQSEPRPTTKLSMIISKRKAPEGTEYLGVSTLYSGRLTGKFPTDRRFKDGKFPEEQLQAQNSWWETGFLVSAADFTG